MRPSTGVSPASWRTADTRSSSIGSGFVNVKCRFGPNTDHCAIFSPAKIIPGTSNRSMTSRPRCVSSR